jgi:hypothetical protein
MKQILTLAIITLIATTLGSTYLYLKTSDNLTNTQTLAEKQIKILEEKLNATQETTELLDIAKRYGIGFDRAEVTILGAYSSMYSTMLTSNGTKIDSYAHQSEYAYFYSTRSNVTLQIRAELHQSNRNIRIDVFKGSMENSSDRTLLYTCTAEPDTYNEFNLVLPSKGWYSISSFDYAVYPDSKFDYFIHVEFLILSKGSEIPFVVRTWNLY